MTTKARRPTAAINLSLRAEDLVVPGDFRRFIRGSMPSRQTPVLEGLVLATTNHRAAFASSTGRAGLLRFLKG
jgi:hypothetical protein